MRVCIVHHEILYHNVFTICSHRAHLVESLKRNLRMIVT